MEVRIDCFEAFFSYYFFFLCGKEGLSDDGCGIVESETCWRGANFLSSISFHHHAILHASSLSSIPFHSIISITRKKASRTSNLPVFLQAGKQAEQGSCEFAPHPSPLTTLPFTPPGHCISFGIGRTRNYSVHSRDSFYWMGPLPSTVPNIFPYAYGVSKVKKEPMQDSQHPTCMWKFAWMEPR